MASPPGTYSVSASDAVGICTVTINFDQTQANKPLVNRGSPARCLVADNSMGTPCPYYVKSEGQGTLSGSVPIGHTDLTVAQILTASGITDLSAVTMGLGPAPA